MSSLELLGLLLLGAAFVALAAYAVVVSLRVLPRDPVVGDAGLLGARAEVLTGGLPGETVKVRVSGELWDARCDRPLDAGQRVRITAVDGLTLRVERIVEAEPPQA